MYVCLCRGVSDRKIRAAIEAGASTVNEVGVQTTAGTVCQDCHPAIEELIRAGGDPDRPADLSARRGRGNDNGQNERGSTT